MSDSRTLSAALRFLEKSWKEVVFISPVLLLALSLKSQLQPFIDVNFSNVISLSISASSRRRAYSVDRLLSHLTCSFPSPIFP